MEFELYVIYDACENRYSSPVCNSNDATAMRALANEAMREGNLWNSHPQDFTLYNIGTYYSNTGEIITHKMERVCSINEIIER